MRFHSIVVSAVLGFLGACGDAAPSCEDVANHVESLAKSEAGIELAPRDVLIRNCKAEESSNAKFRRCVMKATTLEASKGCELEAAFGK